MSLPADKLLVVHVAAPGLPEVTVVVPQPVFVLQVTDPVTTCVGPPIAASEKKGQ